MSLYELESTGGADWRGFRPGTGAGLHWERATVNGTVWMHLVEAAFNFHWGPVGQDSTPNVDVGLVTIGRTDILALRAASSNGQAAFDTAMAGTAAAASYTAMCAAVDNDGITGVEHPANVCRRWWIHCAADYPLS